MKLESKFDFVVSKYLVFLVGWLAAALAIEFSLYGLVGSLSEDVPRLYGSYALRSLFFIFSSAMLVGAMHAHAVKINPLRGVFPEKQHHRQDINRRTMWGSAQTALLVGVLSTNFGFLVLLFFDPALFSSLALEGAFVEPLSALFFFIGAAVLGWEAFQTLRQTFPYKRVIVAGLVCLAFIFFVIAMEEVSWFQRALEFETPEAFSSNLQGEFNLHNFATKIFEIAFYTGAFVCLIALPFLSITSVIPQKIKGLEVFLGGGFTLCISSIFVANNYHYWNSFATQLPYFLTLLALVSLGLLAQAPRVRNACFIFVAALLLTQVAYFMRGHSMGRFWDATEYKEFFIALSFLLYAFDVRRNLLRHTTLSSK